MWYILSPHGNNEKNHMTLLDFILTNLLNPAIMCFILGIIAVLSHSNLSLDTKIFDTIAIYMLLAIGIKGGMKISHSNIVSMILPIAATLSVALITTMLAYILLRSIGKIDYINAASIAAHHGSVSVVTFMAATAYLAAYSVEYEPFMTALVAILEIPSIIIALSIVHMKHRNGLKRIPSIIIKSLFTKSILLLVGGLLIGIVTHESHHEDLKIFFELPFKGVLCLFLLQMGITTAKNWGELKKVGKFLVIFNIIIPIPFAIIGILFGKIAGLSVGGATLLGVMAASSSYIAVPAAMKASLPEANQSLPLVSTLGINMPFNIVIGITIYYYLAQVIYKNLIW
ncbi:MAG: sodium-dependent bicarbonate transport family permease [Alphaproteobacteria bacterium]|nr:sodium-dependent bicarbonate transport family permease [Alphaproteobacteria bacterium]